MVLVGGCDECKGWNGGESGGIEVAEQERGEGCGAWCAVMGDWEGRGGEVGRGVVYCGLLLSVGRGRRDSVVMAWRTWEAGGGRRRVPVVWCWGEGGGQGWAKGGCWPLSWRRPGDFDLRFFLADVLEMSCLVKCWTVELKG